MKSLLNLVLELFNFISWSNPSKLPISLERDGVSFICPRGWRIADKEKLENGYYIAMVRGNSGGLINITWLDEILSINECIETYKEELNSRMACKFSKLTFGEIFKSQFKHHKSTSVEFECNFIGSKYNGIIHIFFEKNKTFLILKQESIKDIAENESGFEQIENSFAVK